MNVAGELKLYVNESEDLAASLVANISTIDFINKEINSLIQEQLIVGIIYGATDTDFAYDMAETKEVELSIEPNSQIAHIKGVFDDLKRHPNAYRVTVYIEYEEVEQEELIDKQDDN